jgi:hypothetical protein
VSQFPLNNKVDLADGERVETTNSLGSAAVVN